MPEQQKKDSKSLQELKDEVTQAKLDLLLISQKVDPLSSLREHPMTTLGIALAGGFFLGALKPLKLAPLVPIALEAGELLLKRANAKYD